MNKNLWLSGWTALILAGIVFMGCERRNAITQGETAAAPVQALAKRGDVTLDLTYNVTPNPGWQPGQNVVLYADARRNPALNQEDIFSSIKYPGTYPRTANQHFNFSVSNVRAGEKVIVQGYICSELGSDCYPSDHDNPPSCSVQVHILGNMRPSCQPVFTWTGGEEFGGVSCRAECH